MPRYRVYMTDLVTAGFNVEAATPEAAANKIRGQFIRDGELVDREQVGIKVCALIADNLIDTTPLYTERGMKALLRLIKNLRKPGPPPKSFPKKLPQPGE